ncbi:unnamed protein product [Aureobasidium pullulans]|uniref:CENP-V/GFA domain-containing protein n=1 Tax=Aureobasidium pullulans TaxID=5580 RepID=A0A4S8SRL8_AURPU|nr:hypothetical protein D6D27_09475 [Aureobasidium pullulans]THW35165.1 hypothetical protein D6D22_08251 [Aureobasidium pullulans]TIA76928.1 hypothetical protein D6C76_05254 [Aureobasidium pullulans]CAC9890132.1 unnamed protein product [Aureobasidium pullulans]
MIYNGSCHCGSIKIQLEAESVTKAICHCLDCQKRTASAFSVNVIAPREHFKVTQGKTKTWSYTSDSGKDYIVNFCGDCGSTLFGEPTRLPDVVSIKAGCLDNSGTNLGSMDAEVFVERRVDYLKPFEGMKQIVGMI